MSAAARGNEDPSAILWPPPPPHYKLFQAGKEGEEDWPQPPSPKVIDKITNDKGMYMMLGSVRAVADVWYNPKSSSLKREMGKLVEELPQAVEGIVDSMAKNPATARDGLRQYETLVKSIFHGLEVLREHEAKRLALQLAHDQVEDLRSTLTDLRAATSKAKEALGRPSAVGDSDQQLAIGEVMSIKTEGLSISREDPSPKRRKRK
ncbi:hypothetical protein FOL47_010122 [Perkinsus chesapeaki]|uniref:Mediator of RNA polymerase II transcription subunit 7 n=1 Tax=Perkinsus chesapeaki TaxID=330153 RepID=A0A7J6L492_PERCH|nr:hypothetical protein FOL47_010122 [Perkinsus chesapeaki]